MNPFKHSLVTACVGLALVAGSTRVASAGQEPTTTAAAKGDDGTLQSRIETALEKDSTLAPRKIDVDVTKGVVTLTGTVRTSAEKTRAARLAKVTGVTRVENELEIDPKIDQSKIDTAASKTKTGLNKAVDATATAAKKTREGVQKGVGKSEEGVGKAADKTSEAVGKAGDKMSDASITTRVKTKLSGEKLLQNTAIDIDTKDRVVTLKGTVASDAAKDRAATVAGETDGVTRVVNQLVVK